MKSRASIVAFLLSTMVAQSVSFTDLTWTYSDVSVLTNRFPIRPAFKSTIYTTHSVVSGSDIVLRFDKVFFDNTDAMDTNLWQYVVPASGVWHIEAGVGWKDIFNNRHGIVKIRVNGSPVSEGIRIDDENVPNTNLHLFASARIFETNGAIIDVVVQNDQGPFQMIGTNAAITRFQGYWISP